MAVKILHKRSAVQFKSATGAQLELGELGLNYHESGPYLQCKDAAGEIVQLGGVYVGASAPGNELQGAWWLRDSDNTLFLFDGTSWVSIAGGGGGGGGTTTVIGGDGIEAVTAGDVVTVSVDLATNSHGLSIVGGKLQADIATETTLGTVKIGDGIDVDAAGEISVDLSGVDVNADLGYTAAADKGTVTNSAGDDATLPLADATNAGLFTAAEKKQLADLVTEDPKKQDLGYTAATDKGTVTITDGTDATIPLADGTNAGLFTAAEKLKLDGIEAGAQVNDKPVFVGETPPSSPEDGDLWWNSSDDSGRLYVYYDEGPDGSQQWVEASPQGDTLTESDADDLYLSKVSDDTAAGAITFEKVTTHEAGVKVTGGDSIDGPGLGSSSAGNQLSLYYNNTSENDSLEGIIIRNNGRVDIGNNSNDANSQLFVASKRKPDAIQGYALLVQGTVASSTGTYWAIHSDDDIASGENVANFQYYGTYKRQSAQGGTADSVTGFTVSSNIIKGTNETYGFLSNLSDASNTYNFYASGTAPNYFKGSALFGSAGPYASTNVAEIRSNGKIFATNGIVSCQDKSNSPVFDNTGGLGIILSASSSIVQQFHQTDTSSSAFYLNRTGSTTGKLIQFNYATAAGVTATQAGLIRLASANSIQIIESSDYRLKENIVDLPNATDRLKAIKPYQYTFKNEPGVIHEGFVAHELQEHSVLTVTGTKDETESIGTLADYDGTVLED